MSNTTQSPAELIRQVLKDDMPEIVACNSIPGWSSDIRVGGFCNIADAPAAVKKAFEEAWFLLSWPGDLPFPYPDKEEDYPAAVKTFRKEAKKAKKECQKRWLTQTFVLPFPKITHTIGQTLIEEGLIQWHVSLEVKGVKLPVHFWAKPNGASFAWKKFYFPKVKLDKDEHLSMFV
jgi:hypothetical protein